jgi:hypothetical protein
MFVTTRSKCEAMDKFHITQDDFGYWMLSLEKEDGTLTLIAHQFAAPGHLIENANEMIFLDTGDYSENAGRLVTQRASRGSRAPSNRGGPTSSSLITAV